MGLFNFWNRKNNDIENSNLITDKKPHVYNGEESNQENIEVKKILPEIREDVFIEKNPPIQPTRMNTDIEKIDNDIDVLYRHLEQNLEKKGYEDALMNPDMSNMNESIDNIQNNLFITISKVKMYYYNSMRTIDFHIETRRRSGMIDTVDELLSHKQRAEEELRIVTQIEEDAKLSKGLCQSLFMTYKKGFRNGLAAI
jgi:hypothetical protein